MVLSAYLDNSCSAKPTLRASQQMSYFLTERWGTPTAPHGWGQRLFSDIDLAMHQLYALLGASEEDTILFTSSGSEAIHQALFSTYSEVTRQTGKNHYLATPL